VFDMAGECTVAAVRSLFVALTVAAVAVLAACPPQNGPQRSPPSPAPSEGYTPPPPVDSGPVKASPGIGDTCLSAADCASGVCEGQGCGDDTPGTCVEASRACTRDYREYCGCDGQTFHASGSCPGQRYAASGACANP
jgi:hypothetical protein